ncbi:acetylornithine deacetylase [Corynebacterium yudongzhengii]|uniref:Acetylornithine deacetylase n=1 Tax=Corynebacterium yudongzhengii TaxID=2080740 RepID=A0A2U1T4U8_9CORY|nr:M20/M25/M40 family metallo-hydrolase [Corynebacterium yudongzhengii]AWB80979.1 acetylornithine deacetylase [Corynebacterium yudongzhengii]PWC00908.1 acetylornithine deacetylase [Corynebacterium yudongzhengii]
MTLYDDTLQLLRQLIRNACVNDFTGDTGYEYRNANTLEEFFADTDVRIRRFEPHPGRVSIAFTVDGTDDAAEPLTLLGHTDVVPVDESKWTVDPFAAEIIDGKLYGRGSVDMLFMTATMAAVTREVARAGRPRGTLTFVGLADEEARGGWGAKWISENEPDAFSWKNCLSETAGSHLPLADGSDALAINVGEKGAAQRRITVVGDAGHGSTPFGKDFTVVKLGEVARRIAAAEPPVLADDLWTGFVEAFRFDPATEVALKKGDGDYDVFGNLAAHAHAFSHTTISQTVAHAGGPINVLPSTGYLEMDIRPTPGTSQDDIDALLRDALGDLAEEVTIERLISEPATVSPTEGPLWDAVVSTYHELMPDAQVVPVCATGGSDLRFARRLGGVGYGFALHAPGRDLAEANRQLHSHDEHLYLEDLELTVAAYQKLVNKMVR